MSIPLVNLKVLPPMLGGCLPEEKLRRMFGLIGVDFFDREHHFVKRPVVCLSAIGGLSPAFLGLMAPQFLRASVKREEIAHIVYELRGSMGIGAFMSYLTASKTTDELYYQVVDRGELSIAHMAELSFLIAGVSLGVEAELDSQRDLVHLARLTVARTAAQMSPPVVVLYPQHYEAARDIRNLAIERLAHLMPESASRKDALESCNLLFPAAKATAMVVTGSLRNLLKLVAQLGDSGKEEELKRVLAQMNDCLSEMFPEIFPATETYGYQLPPHLL